MSSWPALQEPESLEATHGQPGVSIKPVQSKPHWHSKRAVPWAINPIVFFHRWDLRVAGFRSYAQRVCCLELRGTMLQKREAGEFRRVPKLSGLVGDPT